MVERFLVGQRVRLKRRLATQPWGLLPRGAAGTVTNVGGVGEIDGEIPVWVKMDQHVPSLTPWNNVLLVKSSEITAETGGVLGRLKAALRRA